MIVQQHDPPGATSLDEATAARRTSEAALRHVRAADPSVREVARSLRELRERNHFAETLSAAMRRREV